MKRGQLTTRSKIWSDTDDDDTEDELDDELTVSDFDDELGEDTEDEPLEDDQIDDPEDEADIELLDNPELVDLAEIDASEPGVHQCCANDYLARRIA